ncbi:NADPH-dependent F420 reductase [Sphingobium chlorophenolicum]|uniref:NADP oxidoreductase, coenzyme F420-dependent protein n=1 Tax=Sphingobium chlorophenolicum TaxID=46429 RepID=A0A081RFC9_SPHCR|nr:NAD(P)-binding domain-containing protein [Sphingobium chlorophenolicum]KEQ53902.1 NADP oxidoreductase, coenzyme F420-dependent protein [Sphingobium chlorophenolicum]
MSIGILGAGAFGTELARNLSARGIPAVIANSRGPASLAALAEELAPHVRAVSFDEAARADIVILAVTWVKLANALQGLPHWGSRIVVDAANPDEVPSLKPVELNGRLSSEVVSDMLPGARVVKAFIDIEAEIFNEPAPAGGRRVLFYSGNDAEAKRQVGDLMAQMGFYAVDLGSLAVGGSLAQFPGEPFPGINFVKF